MSKEKEQEILEQSMINLKEQEQVMNAVLQNYVNENANLKIDIVKLQMRLAKYEQSEEEENSKEGD